VEFALWFHDAVYDPRASDNEERSAELAACCLDHAGLPNTFINSVRKLVMVTKRHEAEPDSDEAVLVDVDLGILGQGYKRFAEYEDQIRQEYAWVPNPVFVSRRAEILERFLARKQIFATKLFHDKYELRARRNLETSLLRLKNPSA
jgi:predicted metal-dependent HD superfamily phosphohydrolase